MSEEIDFDDIVDFESDEESFETKGKDFKNNIIEKEVKNDVADKDFDKKLIGNDLKHELKEDIMKPQLNESIKETQNLTIMKNGNVEEKNLTENGKETSENSFNKLNGKSFAEKISLLTGDDEIEKILGKKYEKKVNYDSEDIENPVKINGFMNGCEEREKEKVEDETPVKKDADKIEVKNEIDSKAENHNDELSTSFKLRQSLKLKSTSPIDSDKKEVRDSIAGRIEMTRNYLKALTPDEGLKTTNEPSTKKDTEKTAVFEIGKRNDDSPEESVKDTKEVNGEKALDDIEDFLKSEDSSAQRRQSMDDFIKKILAEAREDKYVEGKDEKVLKKDIGNKEVEDKLKENKKEEDDFMTETDSLLERILSSEDKKLSDNQLFKSGNEEIEKYENLTTKSSISDKINSIIDKGLVEESDLKTSKNRHRINIKERDEAEDEIERILSSKKYEPADKKSKEAKNDSESKNNSSENNEQSNDEPNDEFRNFLNKFKKERQKMFGKENIATRDSQVSVETQEYIKDRTQNIRAVLTQQTNICDNVRSVSKQLDELEREIREVRQATLARKNRLECLENAVNAERKQYEIEHRAALERNRNQKPIQKYTKEVRDQITAGILNKRNSKYSKFTDDQDDIASLLSSSKRRAGSVCSVASLMEEQDGFLSSFSMNSSNDFNKYRSFSKERDVHSTKMFDRNDILKDVSTRSSFIDRSNFDNLFSVQSDSVSKPRSRASIATMDMANSNADDFLNKIRSKYSFLGHKDSSRNSSDITQSLAIENPRGGAYDRMSYAGITHLNSTLPLSNITPTSDNLLLNYNTGQARRALSVADGRSSIHYDKSIGGYTAFPSRNALPHSVSTHRSTNSSKGGEFKSRFLDKVRERRASAIEHSPGASQLADRVMAKIQKDQPVNDVVVENGN